MPGAPVYGKLAAPPTDTVLDDDMADTIGNKSDAGDSTPSSTTKSLMAKAKGTQTMLTKPAADSTANATIADVVGNKSDAAAANNTAAGTESLVAMLKRIMTHISATAADSTSTSAFKDVIGNKSDAAVVAVGSTKSIMGYVKGVIQHFTWTTDQDTTPTLANNTTEQDVITGGSCQPGDLVVWGLNLANVGVASTVRVYMKLDAANYTEVEALRQSVSAGKSAAGNFRVSVSGSSASSAYKVTFQAAAPPGATQIYAQARRRVA